MRTFDELVAQLRSPAGSGFDVPETQADEVLNRTLKRFASLSQWIKEEVDLGTTVAGQDLYDIPDNVVDIHELYIGDQDTQRASARDIMRLKAGVSWLRGGPPWIVFTSRATSSGQKQFQIFPAPGDDDVIAAGVSMVGFCAMLPDDLSTTNVPPFPDDMEDGILDGARAVLYRDLDENPEMGDYYEAKHEAQAEVLRRRGNKRVGSGAFQIKVVR